MKMTKFKRSTKTHEIDGPNVPNGWAKFGQSWATLARPNLNPLKRLTKKEPGQSKWPKTPTKPLILLLETALQLQLHMVCQKISPQRAKPAIAGPLSFAEIALPPSKGEGLWGAIAALIIAACLTAAQACADGWKPVVATTEWNSADRFLSAAKKPVTAKRNRTSFVRQIDGMTGPAIDRLLTLIHKAESPRLGYDSVNHRARVKPPKAPSTMTLGQIFDWIKKTPGQPHAIGRYQVIPKTLARVSRELSLKPSTVYDKRTQDLIGRHLVAQAGYSEFVSGKISRNAFMDRLAKVWAGLPQANGRSAYHGYAGNRATISRASYARAMESIFPPGRASK